MKNINLKIIILLFVSLGCQVNSDNQYQVIFNDLLRLIEENYYQYLDDDEGFMKRSQDYIIMVSDCHEEEDFISLVNSFLFSFNDSHIGFGKLEDIHEKVSPYLWYSYTAGVDVRIIGGRVIISAISEKIATESVIHTGDEILKIDNKSIEEIFAGFTLRPPNNKRNHSFLLSEEILRNIYATDDSELNLTIRNKKDQEEEITISRKKRLNGSILFEGLPEVYLDIKSKVYSDSIGYLGFNAFQPSNPQMIIDHLEKMKHLPNMIVDLRGNNGGSVEALRRIASEFLKKDRVSYNVLGQDESEEFICIRADDAYKGKLVLLIDELSISAAEIFSDLMQYSGSAEIVGVQTPGNVLSGELFSVVGDYRVLLPISDWIREDGYRLEGKGVVPNYTVKLTSDDLGIGVDTQLSFAMNLLR